MKAQKEYWESRYLKNRTGWDIGEISPPLKKYIDQLKNKDLKILIPGAGNAYEAEYLHQNGFKNVTVLDFAASPLQNLKERFPLFPEDSLIQEDFFKHTGQYDLILEQTFFCAIPVHQRPAYCLKSFELLNKEGKIAGVLFNRSFEQDGPPYGGNRQEYINCFEENFDIKVLELCDNSILQRQGNELFFIFKKNNK